LNSSRIHVVCSEHIGHADCFIWNLIVSTTVFISFSDTSITK
jgi:hypothetical protein